MIVVFGGLAVWAGVAFGVCVWAWVQWRKPVEAFMDPAIAEDREVRMLDEWWALPTREPLS